MALGYDLGHPSSRRSTDERVASLIAKVLRGAKPGELPIERPSKFDLVVNLKVAKALNIAIPESVLARANRVIRY